jgi:hypothetical protein
VRRLDDVCVMFLLVGMSIFLVRERDCYVEI